MIRILCIWGIATCFYAHCSAQSSFDPDYRPFKSHSRIQDKDFYLFTLMEQPIVGKVLEEDTLFRRRMDEFRELLSRMENDPHRSPQMYAREFLWTPEEIAAVSREWANIELHEPSAVHYLAQNLRRSGYCIQYAGSSDTTLLRKAWGDAVNATDKVILNYTTNKGFRYAAIDSATFSPESGAEQEMLGETLALLCKEKDSLHLFFQPGLHLALGVLFINNRDEAARFEPMDSTNRNAYARIPGTYWARYPYSVILIPGEGPENDWAISPMGKYRCQLGAAAYRQGKAPFIMVSGGYVHPFQTPYCEAAEMKTYLVRTLGIPESAVILEPHARHTTTNVRNANRIIFHKGIPADKRVLCVSTSGQIAYISNKIFSLRCQFEMGEVPYKDMEPIDTFDVSYLPDQLSLQMDAIDPLDP